MGFFRLGSEPGIIGRGDAGIGKYGTRSLVAGFVGWLALCLLVPVIAPCETLEILGVPFRVENISSIDGSTVSVTVFADRVLVARNLLNDYVVKTYFSNERRGGTMAPNLMRQFLKNAFSARQFGYAEQALSAAVLSGAHSVETINELIRELPNAASLQDVLQGTVRRLNQAAESGEDPSRWLAVCQEIVLWIAGRDLAWVRTNAARWVYQYSQGFQERVTKRFYAAIANGQDGAAKETLQMALNLYGDNDSVVQDLRLVEARLSEIQLARQAHDAATLIHLAEVNAQEQTVGRALYPVLSEALHAEAERLIAHSQPELALQALARTEMAFRRPTTHTLIRQALNSLGIDQVGVINDESVARMLILVAQNDKRVLSAYLAFLTRSILGLLKAGQMEESAALLRMLETVRPDPSPDNDRLRISQAAAYATAGLRNSALRQLDRVKTGVGLGGRLKLWFAGLYVGRVYAYFIFIVALTGLVALVAAQAYRLLGRSGGSVQGSGGEGDYVKGAGEEGRSFVMQELKAGMAEKLAEYNSCVMKLGLPPDADIKDIKAAYRTAVKLHHPDRLRHLGDGATEKAQLFIEMTEAYERLLVLRRELGLAEVDE